MDPVSLELGTKNLWAWLVRLLSQHSEWLSAKMRFFLPTMDLDCSTEALDPEQRVIQQLSRLHNQGTAVWQSFIFCLCMELDVPLNCEVPLLSIWGQKDEIPKQLKTEAESQTGSQLHHGLKRPHQSCGTSPRRKHCRKQKLELAKKYLQLLKTFAQQHHSDEGPGSGHNLRQAYVPPILQWSRATAPLDAQDGTSVRDHETEDDIDTSIKDLFNFKAHKGPRVTVLLGKAGMGKTTLAHWLRQKWANGQLDHFQALFLFEFRLLNLITRLLTLSQLLFDLYLSPESGPDDVLQYLEENACRVLLIFDGLDEALHLHPSQEPGSPDGAGSALTLFSRLCRGFLLPGCWVMATSRPGKLPTCVPTEAAMVYMWGFDGLRVEKYMSHFFSDLLPQEEALAEIRTNRQLWGMCEVPALCRVACLCLHHLIPRNATGQSAALLPTMTQLYLQMVTAPCETLPVVSLMGLGKVALRGLDTGKVVFSAEDIPPALMAFGASHSLLTSFCVHSSPERQETGYAFNHLNLQEFLAALYLMASDRVAKNTLACHVTLNSHWVLRTKTKLGLSDNLPTFLAGLAAHACRPFLSCLAQQDEAWVSSRQAAVVQVLKKLATRKLTGPKMVELCRYVAETQEPELAQLTAQSLPFQLSIHNFPLTCTDLAALTDILEHRAAPIHLAFDGCPLKPHCPEALVGCGQVENLSFKSRKCGDTFAEVLSRSLPTMGSLQTLGLTGCKITARGIHHLLEALPLCSQLEEVSLQDNQLKDSEVLSLVQLLPRLQRLQKLDLSRNNFSTSTLLCLVKTTIMYPTLRKLQVRESDLIFFLSPLTEATPQGPRAPDLQDEDDQSKEGRGCGLTLRLQKCQLRVHDMEVLLELLQECPRLEEVDLSGNYLEDEGCRLMAEAAPQLHILQKLDLSDNGLSKTGVAYVLRAMSTCQTLTDLHISLLSNTVVLMFTNEREQEDNWKRAAPLGSLAPSAATELSRSSGRIRLTCCGFQPKHIEKLCKELGAICQLDHLGHLDLSDNALGDEGAVLLAQQLPHLGPLQSLNLSKNGLSLSAVFSLIQCMSSVQWVFHLDVSLESEHVLLQGSRTDRDASAGGCGSEFPARAPSSALGQHCIPRSFRLQECQLQPSSLAHLCAALEKCPGPLEVQLSCKTLSDKSLETLLQCLPRLPQLSLLQLSHTVLNPRSPFLLADLFRLCPRVQKVVLRSLHHVALHFGSSMEQDGVCCGFLDCSLVQEQVEPLCCALSKCEGLDQLDLTANQLGDGGLRCLLEHLPQLSISGRLDLSHNGISQEGVLNLLEMLPSLPRVREVLVGLVSKKDFQIHFSKQEEAGTTLRLSECSFTLEHVSRLAAGVNQAEQLVELFLTRCGLDLPQLTNFLSLVRRPAGLLNLRVEEPWVGQVGLPALLKGCAQASGYITELSISETQQQLWLQLTFPRQEENAEAVILRLAHSDLGTRHSLLAQQLVETCDRLQQLSLSQVNLCDEDVDDGGGGAGPQLLRNLLLSPCELKSFRLITSCVSTEGLAHLTSGLGHCHHLEELDFSNNQFHGESACEEGIELLMGTLQGIRRLKRLHLSHFPLGGSALTLFTQGLSHMTALQCLWLSKNSIDDAGCRHLSEALRAATGLEELSLSYNLIGDAGAQLLAAVLLQLPKLRKIDLSWNSIGLEGGTQLAKSLVLCRKLEEVILGHNALGDPTAIGLAQGLPPQLKVLCLPSSGLGPQGALCLAQALEECLHMEELSLAENSLAGGVPHFCKGLPLLRQIDLVSCKIDDQAAKPLAASLMLCPALEEILLSWNLLGDEAAAELAKVLPLLGQLKKLDLEKNRITVCGAQLLAQGLARGSCVQIIRLWNNPIPADVAQNLQSQEPRLNFAFFDKQSQETQGT